LREFTKSLSFRTTDQRQQRNDNSYRAHGGPQRAKSRILSSTPPLGCIRTSDLGLLGARASVCEPSPPGSRGGALLVRNFLNRPRMI
jgi:hypothetical protein